MKNLLFILLCSPLLLACNQGPEKSKSQTQESHASELPSELSHNNGARWKSDSVTNNNVSLLRGIAADFKTKSTPSQGDYEKLSADLSTGLNKMIEECKMTGADHQALHMWLQPILEENAELKNSTNTASSEAIFSSTDKALDNYNNYFELQ